MKISVREFLKEKKSQRQTPRLKAFNRIDGPGSSLDLREFQQALWQLPNGKIPTEEDEFSTWSKKLPRTVGITIGTGCIVEAVPTDEGMVEVISRDYGVTQKRAVGQVPYREEFWLLKIMDLFGLNGVKFELRNSIPGIKSSGLGGSSTAATAVAIMANKLTGQRFGSEQIVGIASLIEQDMGNSITGTQEQSNVMFGGVVDYVWFPWGVPGQGGAFGSSIRHELILPEDYSLLESRIRIYHSGKERKSSTVNSVWRRRLKDEDGLIVNQRKVELAFEFREGLRSKDWNRAQVSIAEYAKLRVSLCAEYMSSECWDIQGQCKNYQAESFPLGAGGGGAVMVFCEDPERLNELDKILKTVFRSINYSIKENGHEFSCLHPDELMKLE